MQCSYLRGSPAADQRRTQGEGPKTRRAVGNGDREAREHEAGRCGSGLAGGLASAGACDQLAPPTCSETALPSRFAGLPVPAARSQVERPSPPELSRSAFEGLQRAVDRWWEENGQVARVVDEDVQRGQHMTLAAVPWQAGLRKARQVDLLARPANSPSAEATTQPA